jgi:hypothetical protein
MISINTNSSPAGNVTVTAQHCCSNGSSSTILNEYIGTDYNCGYYMSFVPNPVADETTMELNTDNIENYTEEAEWEIGIYDQQQLLQHKEIKLKGVKYKIKTNGWKSGNYFVRVKINNQLLSGKFVVIK